MDSNSSSATSSATEGDMAMPPPSGTSNMAMGSSSSSSGAMTFFNSLSTPLLWSSWQPSNAGAYAGTCLFLVALGTTWRVMVALKPILEQTLWRRESSQHAELGSVSVVPDSDPEHQHQHHRHSILLSEKLDDDGDDGNDNKPWEMETFLPSGVRPVGRVVRTRWRGATLTTRSCRAVYEAAMSGIGMLAVMTMNVGYFLSVVAGIFIGTFSLGNLAVDEGNNRWHNC